jgi:hypothetical protein
MKWRFGIFYCFVRFTFGCTKRDNPIRPQTPGYGCGFTPVSGKKAGIKCFEQVLFLNKGEESVRA